ncbi:FecR family protein [Luteimonas panaciterrae]|uniref:FecR family protein n=1 Tax=Luteimonas panaciterrae TaxID=363885 RepID=UPI001CFA63D8|nr:FecR domain-containing protein [Luteimonas panaciterrae]
MKRTEGPSDRDSLERASAWCLRLAEGELSANEQADLQAWLDADPQHHDLLTAAQRAWRITGEQPTHPRMQALRRAALEDAHASRRARRRTAMLATAACCLLAVGLVWWWWMPRVYQTGIGERTSVTLADGSTLLLDAATRVEVRIRAQRRDLRLEYGRATFAVAKDPSRPFSVSAGDSTVIATGTRFSVERLPRQLRVVLYEGRVEVADNGVAASGIAHTDANHNRTLTPGQELIASSDATRDTRIARVDTGNARAWERGLLVFRDESLDLAVARVNRYSRQTLRIGDTAASRIRISGVFKAGDTPAFVAGVTSAFPLRANRGDDAIVLESRSH